MERAAGFGGSLWVPRVWSAGGVSVGLAVTPESSAHGIKSELCCGTREFASYVEIMYSPQISAFFFFSCYFAFCLGCRKSPRSKHFSWLNKKIPRYLNVLAYACESCKLSTQRM